MNEIWGQDIKLDSGGQAMVAANGELQLTDDTETGLQDIRIMLETPLGSLFYDSDFGCLIYQWIKEENTLANRMAFCAEVVRRVNNDARVQFGSTSCSIRSWDENGISANVSWSFIEEDHVYNLALSINESMEMVINDVNTRE